MRENGFSSSAQVSKVAVVLREGEIPVNVPEERYLSRWREYLR